MNYKRLLIPLLVLFSLSCKEPVVVFVDKIEGKRIPISDSLDNDSAIEAYIEPYRTHINKDLDSVLAYAVDTYSPRPEEGELETAIGNLMADVAFIQANPVFKKRTGKTVDMVLLNHGGIRAPISKGNISARVAYSVMPFDNSLVVVDLKGDQVNELVEYLAKSQRANPIAKLKLKLDEENEVVSALINGEPIDPEKNYFVATYDYLYNGGGNMTFFKTNDSLYELDYKMRNAMIDYFKKVDTIKPTKDGRFIKTLEQ
ncbi:MAG: 5'-nucleotidase C-terminal domain-containing protein [Bacteroidia bacterium]|nr:5'-nucleotidase C-terminal domain-containing protein [Bacteroidia bacterium]NND10275.1 5'-nucleotidase C-terminal domain-containing protein [Flavobacteriaceae bacterium]MBT8309315.1 5'-nucleotidase C-terminal domain-containing protein [Bacteroidia bacterium]NNK29172.1 5'-nucleotidase C-terminal domain-containing protein [Flavobacteriaceae bacterium]NNL62067.1 5'-nucleotidase C-terminal domain-containing protein [Flavobacteriaceae bacterium]